MLFVVRLLDDPSCFSVRQTFMQQHLTWLEQHRDVVLVAGSLRVEPDANPIGACWIVRAATQPEVESLLRSDPFWVHGLRQQVEVLLWSKAFPDREILV